MGIDLPPKALVWQDGPAAPALLILWLCVLGGLEGEATVKAMTAAFRAGESNHVP